jgi:hypothetical protein
LAGHSTYTGSASGAGRIVLQRIDAKAVKRVESSKVTIWGWSLSHYSNWHNYKVYWFSVNWTNTFKWLYLFLSDLPKANQGF